MAINLLESWKRQQKRNEALIAGCTYMREQVESQVLPLHVDLVTQDALTEKQVLAFEGLSIETARTAVEAVGSLATINEVDHLGGGLDLVTALLLTLSVVDYEKHEFTIEHAHTSIGYYAALATLGFLDRQLVIDTFRRGLDIPGHVSWVPGGTQLNGGRLGVMVPAAVGQALGKKARLGEGSFVICHCGDAGWISGQALNGFNAADLHGAPVAFVMHRNGIQLSGSNASIMDKDPRPIIQAMGIDILEITSLHDFRELYAAYREAYRLAGEGRPCLIYPHGMRSTEDQVVDLNLLGEKYGIAQQVREKADANQVGMDTRIWIPGALMSYRDVDAMLDCVFLVNRLPGGKGHHDGHMKGRDVSKVLANPMLQATDAQRAAVEELKQAPKKVVVTRARPEPGSANLLLPAEAIKNVELPLPGKMVSPRAGSEAAYAVLAETFPESVFVVGCDLDTSTKLDTAKKYLADDHTFEMSIEEQVSAIMANGLSTATHEPQLTVFSTFSAFFAGIAREGFDMWRYQRNLNGVNEGLNVTFHLSHVGACTGRDHFSGWDLDWINTGLSYLPYLQRFYMPADARIAFKAVCDLASRYGGHVIGIPRDSLPVLTRQDSQEPLWDAESPWEDITVYRQYEGARKAIVAVGAPSFLAGEAADLLQQDGLAADVHIINSLPLSLEALTELIKRYPDGVVTVEDGIISSGSTCLQGIAGLISNAAAPLDIPTDYIGIVDPRVAPADGYMELWEYFGISAPAIADAVKALV
jgi:transketolase N-terminal domain/subunit/transketolase C-terminal domain/subunit